MYITGRQAVPFKFLQFSCAKSMHIVIEKRAIGYNSSLLLLKTHAAIAIEIS